MKNSFPIVAAIGLIVLWVALFFAIPATMDLFKNFKVEMPALTMAVLQVSHLFGGTALPLLVLTAALLLGFRQFLGWMFALPLCIAWDFALLGLAMPVIALMNNLTGGSGTGGTSAPVFGSSSLALGIIVVLLILNQALLVSLVVKRREFAR